MPQIEAVLADIDNNLEAGLDRLFQLLSISSISTDPAYAKDCRTAAEWLAETLKSIGFDAGVRDTIGHPMVVAHDSSGPADALHVLFYGHYDVQPVDPLSEWDRPPFDPALFKAPDGTKRIHGRGASDDKGQLMTFIEACRSYKEQTGALPCRVTILLEGEEESGSPSLAPFLEANAKELSCDLALVCDTAMWDRNTPAICTGLRGLVGEEIVVTAANRDLHSGFYGGAAANPLKVLSDILHGLHDEDGRVTLKGFYDGVVETPDEIKSMWDGLKYEGDGFLGAVGLSEPAGEKGRSIAELTWARPTAEINGLIGGYTGEGFKTVIPSRASAKVSFRLVGDQDPEKIRQSFRVHVNQNLPKDCTVEFIEHGGSPAIQLSYDSHFLSPARQALSDEWPNEALLIAMGGSIPIVGEFRERLDMESLLVGFALSEDRIHSPNETYSLSSFHKGIRSWARILESLSANHREVRRAGAEPH